MTSTTQQAKPKIFSSYQAFIIAILAILQFTIVLDFMVLSPLGALLLEELHINTSQFGLVVSAYAFSAGASGLLAAGFADRFDRKKMLLFFYTGFIIGTVLCAIAPTYHFLLLVPFKKNVQAINFDSTDPAFAGEMIMEVTLEQEDSGTKVTFLF